MLFMSTVTQGAVLFHNIFMCLESIPETNIENLDVSVKKNLKCMYTVDNLQSTITKLLTYSYCTVRPLHELSIFDPKLAKHFLHTIKFLSVDTYAMVFILVVSIEHESHCQPGLLGNNSIGRIRTNGCSCVGNR